MFFLGPLTTSLCEKLGCRIVTICGGLICIAGLLLSSMATSLLPFYLTYGLMFGSGTSLCYFPTIIVLSKYFKKRIAVVNGLVTSGSGVGTLVISPVVQALFLRFGVASTFRIVAGIYSVILLCGATFRPVPAKYSQYNNRTEGEGPRRLFDWSIFKNKGYLIWIASLATFQLGYFVPFVHLVRDLNLIGGLNVVLPFSKTNLDWISIEGGSGRIQGDELGGYPPRWGCLSLKLRKGKKLSLRRFRLGLFRYRSVRSATPPPLLQKSCIRHWGSQSKSNLLPAMRFGFVSWSRCHM